MKTKFLPKLLLFSLFCVVLNSCTGDEILSYTEGATTTTSDTSMSMTTISDSGTEPVLTKPK